MMLTKKKIALMLLFQEFIYLLCRFFLFVIGKIDETTKKQKKTSKVDVFKAGTYRVNVSFLKIIRKKMRRKKRTTELSVL